MEARYGGTGLMQRSCAMARGKDTNMDFHLQKEPPVQAAVRRLRRRLEKLLLYIRGFLLLLQCRSSNGFKKNSWSRWRFHFRSETAVT
jgi:hypothetical protein